MTKDRKFYLCLELLKSDLKDYNYRNSFSYAFSKETNKKNQEVIDSLEDCIYYLENGNDPTRLLILEKGIDFLKCLVQSFKRIDEEFYSASIKEINEGVEYLKNYNYEV